MDRNKKLQGQVESNFLHSGFHLVRETCCRVQLHTSLLSLFFISAVRLQLFSANLMLYIPSDVVEMQPKHFKLDFNNETSVKICGFTFI